MTRSVFSLTGRQFRIWAKSASCPLPRPTRFTSKKIQAMWDAPRTSCAQNYTAATLEVVVLLPPYTALTSALLCYSTLGPPLLLHQKWRLSPRTVPTLPEGIKKVWILWWYVYYYLLLMLSGAPTTPTLFWFMWVILHRDWFISTNI
jgi:hypothetical protein